MIQDPVPLSMASQTAPMSTTFRESGLITCSFSPSPAGLGELSLDQSLVSVGELTPRCPDFLVHVLPPSAPHLDLGGSVSNPVWVSVSISIHCQIKVLWWYAKYSSVWLWLWAKASSGSLSSAVQGTIGGSLLGPGNPSRIKSLADPHRSTGLSPQRPNEEQKEGEHEQGSQDHQGCVNPLT